MWRWIGPRVPDIYPVRSTTRLLVLLKQTRANTGVRARKTRPCQGSPAISTYIYIYIYILRVTPRVEPHPSSRKSLAFYERERKMALQEIDIS